MGIKVLDCTLRDGAYVTNAFFGENCIKNIIKNLNDAKIEIIECGWLCNKEKLKGDVLFNKPEDLGKYQLKKNAEFALMFDFGKYSPENLTHNSGIVDIIRIAFHKEELDKISFVLEKVKSMGYKVFLQPSNILGYDEKEIEKLCRRANFTGVEALYIVDSYGSMFPEDLDRIMPVFYENTDKNIDLGFHSHNNIQLSLGLTIQFINYMKSRNIIVDSSLCGIGRGAGNTKTELLTEYLNRSGHSYNTSCIWETIENNLTPLYQKYNWEYNPKRGFRGINGIHPAE